MSLLIESIETVRAEQLRIIAKKEAAEKAETEALLASRFARQAEIDQIYARCQNIIDESHIMELFNEANRDLFKGTGKIYNNRNFNPVHHNVGGSYWHVDQTDFYVRRGIKGIIDKTPTLLIAEATLSESPEKLVSSPALTISCHVGKRESILDRVLRREVIWDWGSSETLRERVLEEQEQPINEWQNPDNVAKSTAKVLVKAGVL